MRVVNKATIMNKLPYLIVIVLASACNTYKPAKMAKAPKELKPINKMYSYVPKGIVKQDFNEASSHWTHVTVGDFFIHPTEISNHDWKEYLYWLKVNKPEAYNENLPDTTVWTKELTYCEPYVAYYFQHPAYRDYPVVGITKKQAEDYCEFLTTALKTKYPEANIKARLPTKSEWLRAARDTGSSPYPQGPFLRNSRGCYLYNFRVVGDHRIDFNDSTKKYIVHNNTSKTAIGSLDGGLITTEIHSYFPNKFGLYNMSGNVAELIADDNKAMGGSWLSTGYNIRLDSEQEVNGPSSTIGFRPVLEIIK